MITDAELFACAADIFRCAPESLSLATAYGEYPAWDSLAHLRLIMAAEAQWHCRLPIDVIPEIKTLADLKVAIMENLQEARA